ncbi:MAG: hypothetical protein IKG04_00580 [Exiguobacterium sp.]|nr:hypothetical protein [Exiguobacterium sp.]
MLELEVKGGELYDEVSEMFISVKPVVLRLEHSLVSISKWESIWKEPFLTRKDKTEQQTIDYLMCMTLNQNVDPEVYKFITPKQLKLINEYISDEKTATTFNERHSGAPNRQVITSELIYFWMAQYNIPFDCQKWHLSRLLTLIRIASIKNAPDKKMSRNAVLSQNRALNEARRKALRTKG